MASDKTLTVKYCGQCLTSDYSVLSLWWLFRLFTKFWPFIRKPIDEIPNRYSKISSFYGTKSYFILKLSFFSYPSKQFWKNSPDFDISSPKIPLWCLLYFTLNHIWLLHQLFRWFKIPQFFVSNCPSVCLSHLRTANKKESGYKIYVRSHVLRTSSI